MADYYCKLCDKMTGAYHRHFFTNMVRPLKKKPNPNTRLARKLAKIYEEIFQRNFPGGISNAKVVRLAQEGYGDAGAWKWCLEQIEIKGLCLDFGGQGRATDCVKYKIEHFIDRTGSCDIWVSDKKYNVHRLEKINMKRSNR
jgi:hypothetical protein